jgi:hypothetical protein
VHATIATMVALNHFTHVYDIQQEDFLVGKISDNIFDISVTEVKVFILLTTFGDEKIYSHVNFQ